MRFFLLLFVLFFKLNSAEVILSALVGQVTAEKKLSLGDKLEINQTYVVAPESKIQLILNNTAILTISQNSLFSFKEINDKTVRLVVEQGVYKIINLAHQDHRLTLFVDTSELSMQMSDTIALLNVTAFHTKAACVKSSFLIEHSSKEMTLKRNEMIDVEYKTVQKYPINFNDFHQVFIKKDYTVDMQNVLQESAKEDPSDLEN